MLTREQLLEALRLLGSKLAESNKTGELLLTGGAAMALVYDARDTTKDIDALYEPKAEINYLAAQIAAELGLPSDWLNDSVKGFVSPTASTQEFLSFPGLRINVVSPEYLLAMKLLSARLSETDLGDARFLLQKLDIKTPDEAYALLEKFYPSEQILPKTMYLIEELLH